jgi:hypothetical protein
MAKAKAERTRKREAEASPYARTAAGFPTGSSSANQTAGIAAATDELGMDAALEPVLPEAAATMRRQLFVARREERRVAGDGLCFYAALKTMLETEVAGGSAMFDSPRSLRAAILGVFDDDAMLDLPWTDDAARECTVRDCLESFATARGLQEEKVSRCQWGEGWGGVRSGVG